MFRVLIVIDGTLLLTLTMHVQYGCLGISEKVKIFRNLPSFSWIKFNLSYSLFQNFLGFEAFFV